MVPVTTNQVCILDQCTIDQFQALRGERTVPDPLDADDLGSMTLETETEKPLHKLGYNMI